MRRIQHLTNKESKWSQQDPGPRHAGTPPVQCHGFLLVPLGQCLQQTLGTNSESSPIIPRGSSTPRCSNMSRITASFDARSLVKPGSQGPRGTLTPSISDTPRISESQDPRITASQRQLDSEEFGHNQDHREDRLQSAIARAGSTRDNQMAGGKLNNININQGYLA